MRTLIIGGAGFLGSHLTKRCLDEGEVILIDNLSSGKKSNIPDSLAEKNTFLYPGRGDVCDFDFDRLEGRKIDVAFYLATKPGQPSVVQASIDNPADFDRENVGGFVRFLDFARRHHIPVVYSSSSAIYGDATIKPTDEFQPPNPTSPYALQKLICEQYLNLFGSYGLRSVALRYFNIFGEGQPEGGAYATVIGKFLKCKELNKPFISIGDNTQRRDFVYVQDVVEANIKAAEFLKDNSGSEVFNIGSGKNYSVEEIADLIAPHLKWGEKLPARLEPRETLADCSKAKSVLNWSPTKDLEAWLQ